MGNKKIIISLSSLFVSCAFLCNCGANEAIPIYRGMSVVEQIENENNFLFKKANEQKNGKDIEALYSIKNDEVNNTQYYAEPNKDFILKIDVENPNNFEIQSFTFNGQEYGNHVFEQASTTEEIFLKIPAGSDSGYKEYTIDTIKYIENSEIKNVDMSKASKTIKVGVKNENLPIVIFSEKNISTIELNLKITIDTNNCTIKDGVFEFLLSDGISIIHTEQIEQLATVAFDDLEPNKSYQYGVFCLLDQIDGKGYTSVCIGKESFITDVFYSIDNVSVTYNSIHFEIIKKYDNCEINFISLINQNTGSVVSSSNTLVSYFSDLTPEKVYTISLEYNYKNKGLTFDSKIEHKDIKTDPHIYVIRTEIIGSNECTIGETISIKINLFNESEFIPIRAKINDKEILCLSASTKNIAYLSIIIDSSFPVGDIELAIDEIGLQNGKEIFILQTSINNKVSIKAYGKVSLLKVSFVDSDNNELYACHKGSSVRIMVTLDNGSYYALKNVEFNLDVYTVTKIDDQHYYFMYLIRELSENGIYLTGYTYNNGAKDVYIKIEPLWCRYQIYSYQNEVVETISTPHQLQNMQRYCHYELSQDIDLTNFNWVPYDFDAFLDGKGYSIKNYSANTYCTSVNMYAGLFRKTSGHYANLSFKNITLIVTVEDGTPKAYIGLIAGITGYGVWDGANMMFNNVHIEDSCTIFVGYKSSTTLYLGSFLGSHSGNLIFKSCSSKCNVIPANTNFVGPSPTSISDWIEYWD